MAVKQPIDPEQQERLFAVLLPHLPRAALAQRYIDAPGGEITSGKFFSPQSSAALAANAFGLFLERPSLLPPLPHIDSAGWRPIEVTPEAILRFPWKGGRHPCLDVVVRTPTALIGIESKRYEPCTAKKPRQQSDAYLRDVWGTRMTGYYKAWQDYLVDMARHRYLDVAQLVKHAFAIRTRLHAAEGDPDRGRSGTLYYLYADPPAWPDGTPVDPAVRDRHRQELENFAATVNGDEVEFVHATYAELLASWRRSGDAELEKHAEEVASWAGIR